MREKQESAAIFNCLFPKHFELIIFMKKIILYQILMQKAAVSWIVWLNKDMNLSATGEAQKIVLVKSVFIRGLESTDEVNRGKSIYNKSKAVEETQI